MQDDAASSAVALRVARSSSPSWRERGTALLSAAAAVPTADATATPGLNEAFEHGAQAEQSPDGHRHASAKGAFTNLHPLS